MKKIKRILTRIFLCAFGLVILALLVMTIYNHIMLKQEAKLIRPNGTFVTVDGYKMHVYTEGQKGKRPTILMMSAFGTAAPVYDYKILYSKLSNEYHIAVVEKFGYGYSDITGLPRDVLAESNAVDSNAQTVQKGGIPNVPTLLFSSDDPALGDQWAPCERQLCRPIE